MPPRRRRRARRRSCPIRARRGCTRPSRWAPTDIPAYPLSRREWKEWRRNYKQQMHGGGLVGTKGGRTIGERIMHFRRHIVSTGSVIAMLAGINLLTSPRFPWFLFPAIPMFIGLLKQWGGLWAEGVTLGQILARPKTPELESLGAGAEPRALPAPVMEDEAAKLAPREVLAGSYGTSVRRAVADRAAVLATVNTLSKTDRDLIPDVVPTVTALVERVASLAQTLHHLDADCSPVLDHGAPDAHRGGGTRAGGGGGPRATTVAAQAAAALHAGAQLATHEIGGTARQRRSRAAKSEV